MWRSCRVLYCPIGEQRWCSAGSTRLPNPGVDATCGTILLVVLSERFFSGYSGFPLSWKTNISKFQFDRGSGRQRSRCAASKSLFLYLVILFIYLFIYSSYETVANGSALNIFAQYRDRVRKYSQEYEIFCRPHACMITRIITNKSTIIYVTSKGAMRILSFS